MKELSIEQMDTIARLEAILIELKLAVAARSEEDTREHSRVLKLILDDAERQSLGQSQEYIEALREYRKVQPREEALEGVTTAQGEE